MRELTQIMYAHKGHQYQSGDEFFRHIYGNFETTRICLMGTPKPIYEIEVSIDPDQSSEEPSKKAGYCIEYWGIVRPGDNKFTLVQSAWSSFAMQFPGVVEPGDNGHLGEVYKLLVRELREVKNS